MVTNYNTTDLVKFGQHIANWIANGMIIADANGIYPITKKDIDNWLIGEKSNYSICPKALSIAQLLTAKTHLSLDRDLYCLEEHGSGIVNEAIQEGVVIAYPWVNTHHQLVSNAEGEPVINIESTFENKKWIKNFLDIRSENSQVPYVHVSVPFASFPIFGEGDHVDDVIGFGACFHISDIANVNI